MQRNGESKLAADETTETTHHRSLISNYGIVKVKGSRLTKAGAAFVFFYFFTYEKICGHYCPHCGSPTVQIVGEINSNSIFTLSMLHFPAVASHTPLLCFESVCHFFFFFFLEQAVFHSSSHAGTHLSFFFFFSPRLILG